MFRFQMIPLASDCMTPRIIRQKSVVNKPRITHVVVRAGSGLLVELTKAGGRAARQKNIVMASFRTQMKNDYWQ
jgi:hypothetical protein